MLVVMLGVVVASALASEAYRDLPTPPIRVGEAVAVSPAGGWELERRLENGSFRLTNGTGSILIGTSSAEATPRQVLDDEVAALGAETKVPIVFGDVEDFEVQPGVRGARVIFSGALEGIEYPVEGQIIAVKGARDMVVFVAWADLGSYVRVLPDVDRMVREARFS